MKDAKTTGNGTTGNGASAYALSFEIVRRWAGLPGATLKFNLRLYLSGELSAARESTIGLDPTERLKALADFRTRVLADVLTQAPEGFPDFPEEVAIEGGKSTKLRDRAYEFFNRRDAEGFPIFGLLVEDVITEYWRKVTPSPIIPASAS